MGSRPDGWWRDRAGAAARLVAGLRALPGSVVALDRPRRVRSVTVVLEGAARAGVPEGASAGLVVRHAPGSGDDLLAEVAGPGVLLVTADRELAERVRGRGAAVVGPRWLLERAVPAPAPDLGQDDGVSSRTSPGGTAAPPR